MVKTFKSSALSATFRSSPTSPKTNITSAGQEPTRWPLRHRAKAPWPTRLLALVMRPFSVPNCRTFSPVPLFARYSPPIRRRCGGRARSIGRWRWRSYWRNAIAFGSPPDETAANEEALRSAVLTLWQTSMLRGSKLKVVDEIANGLSYYDYTFLRELPRFYAALEDQLASTD